MQATRSLTQMVGCLHAILLPHRSYTLAIIRRFMARTWFVIAVLLALVTRGTVSAQDARGVLQSAVKAMGAGNVKTIQYSGTGWNAAVGQSFSRQEDWPRFEVTRYTRTL